MPTEATKVSYIFFADIEGVKLIGVENQYATWIKRNWSLSPTNDICHGNQKQ